MRCCATHCIFTSIKSRFGGSGMQCNPVVLAAVEKCLHLPCKIWRGRWTNVTTSPAKFGGGDRQMSLPPPPNLAEEVDKCLYLPRQLFATNLKSDF